MILTSHDPAWAIEFAALRDVYTKALGSLVVRVEHVGSTAVPGLRAKPILDVDIVMESYERFPAIVACLRSLGYTHNGDNGVREREAFHPLDDGAPYQSPKRKWMSHHLYVCPANGLELRRHIRFRDALRADAALRRDYERRKLEIASRSGNDRKLYARLKEVECRALIEGVVAIQENADPASDRFDV
jgi:GrpB-like predicted nucleotidyltransferase (UPF0157 family)